MISVVVLVYNAEKTLRKCIDSILSQTYRDLDIVLIDDGSTDGSPRVCDEYAAQDSRIRVYHTPNGGVSLARNAGIERAREKGNPYLGFVDSDDWIEKDMFEILLRTAEENNADIVECGTYYDYPDKTEIARRKDRTYRKEKESNVNSEALAALYLDKMDDHVWSKLWKTSLFDGIVFRPGYSFQDAMETFRILAKANKVMTVSNILYHYVQTWRSIIHTNDKRLVMQWEANKVKFDAAKEYKDFFDGATYENVIDRQLLKCVTAIGKNCSWWRRLPPEDQQNYGDELKAMSSFIKENVPFFGRKNWPIYHRIVSVLARYPVRFTLWLAYWLNQIRRKAQPVSLFFFD